jgi:hypothetical protein
MAKVSITMDVGSTMEGRALASTGAVTFNAASNSLPQPEAPRFTHIFATTNDAVTVILSTTPFLFLTLETCPDLLRTNWTTLTTDTPVSTPWTFTDETVINVLSQRFYRAFLSPNR